MADRAERCCLTPLPFCRWGSSSYHPQTMKAGGKLPFWSNAASLLPAELPLSLAQRTLPSIHPIVLPLPTLLWLHFYARVQNASEIPLTSFQSLVITALVLRVQTDIGNTAWKALQCQACNHSASSPFSLLVTWILSQGSWFFFSRPPSLPCTFSIVSWCSYPTPQFRKLLWLLWAATLI